LAPIGSKTVFSSCSAQKSQITILVAISASGQIIPPMHISLDSGLHIIPLKVEWRVLTLHVQAMGGSKQNFFMVGLKSIFPFVLDVSDQFC
jgi:hypothetical protein